jgi:hypothetical protein
MGAPLGFKTFATGDVLTAADTNGYLMQGVWTFASAAARDAAVTSPQEGNFCFLKDSNTTQFYSGSAWTAVGASKVIQVVYGSTSTSTTNATSTYADTTLTAAITPTLATSKVLVMVAQNGLQKSGANSNNAMGIKIFRGATEISVSTPLMLYTGTAAEIIGTSYAQNILDEPATTSATTYKTQFRNANNGSGITTQYDSAKSTIVLMEIGA